MPDIGNYTASVQFILVEAGKYFLLLVGCILAIRLWRRWVAAKKDVLGFMLAVVFTVATVGFGYISICRSLSLLYSHYGMVTFREGRLPQALELFNTAAAEWRTADALGQQGVCRLLLGDVDQGLVLLAAAKECRHGQANSFENFYLGLYRYTQGDYNTALPLLEAAAKDDAYRWSAIKIFAVIELDENRLDAAQAQMKPYLQAEVTEFDQAYIMAALKLADGKKDEARALLDKFPTTGLSPKWQERFDKLRAKLNG